MPKIRKEEEEDSNLVFFKLKTLLITFCVRGVFFYSSTGSVSSVSDAGSSVGKSVVEVFGVD